MFAHIDMNSYFASVEQQANPHLRGRPLGVCAYLHKNGCVIAASVEAKKQGVKVGMSLQGCRQKCPNMVFVQNDPPKYRAVTSRVFSLLHELTDRVEHYSIDEAFLDLTGWYRDPAEAAWALCRARLRIQAEVGDWLTCSIGIAPSKFLAKLSSDMEKPNGLVIITPENLDDVLGSLDLEDAWGIGRRIKKRLNRLGIFTLLDLKHYPVANLMRALGKAGWLWHERLCGRDVDRLVPDNSLSMTRDERRGISPFAKGGMTSDGMPKSIGHSFCVPRRANDVARRSSRVLRRDPMTCDDWSRHPQKNVHSVWIPIAASGDVRRRTILSILIKLTERAGRRLRSFGLLARRMEVQISFWGTDQISHSSFFGGQAGRMNFSEAVNDVFSLVDGAARLLENLWDGSQPVSFLAVTLMDFSPPSGQTKLNLSFPRKPSADGGNPGSKNSVHYENDNSVFEKRKRTSSAIDDIRDRYGEESIVFAGMLGLSQDYAPDRIGFRKVEID